MRHDISHWYALDPTTTYKGNNRTHPKIIINKQIDQVHGKLVSDKRKNSS